MNQDDVRGRLRTIGLAVAWAAIALLISAGAAGLVVGRSSASSGLVSAAVLEYALAATALLFALRRGAQGALTVTADAAVPPSASGDPADVRNP